MIRRMVINGSLNNTPTKTINDKVTALLAKGIEKIPIPRLKKAVAKSLLAYYKEETKRINDVLPTKAVKNAVLYYAVDGDEVGITKARAELLERGFDHSRQMGVPANMYSKDYIKKLVKPLIEKLVETEAVDPDDITGRNSLRNRAEMEVRYKDHEDNIADLKAQGVKLVVASSHADCSERCSPFQGRVYSLNGTSGVTDDGRKYVPLEVATDIWYTTKKGVRYKNGLLGFNCRHSLSAYESGVSEVSPSPLVQKRERDITAKQREYERAIRKAKAVRETARNLDKQVYTNATHKVKELTASYKEYCAENHRAYYPDNIKII